MSLSTLALAVLFTLTPARAHAQTAVVTNYHLWSNVVSVNNGLVEVLVNPTDGRVQQFRFVGDTDGAFWENPDLFGKTPGGGFRYENYGGDKAWPSPQSAWGWPPPKGFDGHTNSFSIANGTVTLVTSVDTRYKIQSTRTVELLPNQPVMRVTTTFERTAPTTLTNNPLGIWVDCQAAASAESRFYAPVPSPSIFPNGYTTNGSAQFTTVLPPQFTDANGLISFGMPPSGDQKLGFDGGTLVLVGTNLDLRMDAPRVPGADYPDGNSSTEGYTDQGYFELEMMGPLDKLPVGGKMQYVTLYTLFHRTEPTPDAEAKKVLAAHN
jgi:hypothetical protein